VLQQSRFESSDQPAKSVFCYFGALEKRSVVSLSAYRVDPPPVGSFAFLASKFFKFSRVHLSPYSLSPMNYTISTSISLNELFVSLSLCLFFLILHVSVQYLLPVSFLFASLISEPRMTARSKTAALLQQADRRTTKSTGCDHPRRQLQGLPVNRGSPVNRERQCFIIVPARIGGCESNQENGGHGQMREYSLVESVSCGRPAKA
jgi:hypothetical protein